MNVVRDRKQAILLHVCIEMAGIGSQDHPSPACTHPNHLQTLGMPADVMHFDAGRNLVGSVVEMHPLLEYATDHLHHVVGFIGVVQRGMAHAAAGRKLHLAVLQVVARIREQRVVAGVVIMQVGDDQILDFRGRDAQRLQSLGHRVDDLPPAFAADFGTESHIDQDRAIVVPDHPYKIVERHVGVVLVTADEILG